MPGIVHTCREGCRRLLNDCRQTPITALCSPWSPSDVSAQNPIALMSPIGIRIIATDKSHLTFSLNLHNKILIMQWPSYWGMFFILDRPNTEI